jgi:Holliday junction resolvase
MPNSNYVSGRAFEYERVDAWKQLGYEAQRSAGSHGKYDVIAIREDRGVVLIQCKVYKTQAGLNSALNKFKSTARSVKGAIVRFEGRVKGDTTLTTWSI